MANVKCASCGLVNFVTAQECRRCGQLLSSPPPFYSSPASSPQSPAPVPPANWQGTNPQMPPNYPYVNPQAWQAPPPNQPLQTQASQPLPSIWQGNEPATPNPGQQTVQPPSAPLNQQWQAPPPQYYPQAPHYYSQPTPAPQQQWQNPQMVPAYVAGYGQPPAYAATPPTQWTQQSELSGLGGWLILPAIGIVLRPLIALFGAFGCLAFFGAAEAIIANIGLRAYVQLRPIVGFELLANLFMVGFSIYVAIRFFRKKANAPKLYVVLLFIQVVIITLDILLLKFLYEPIAPPTSGDSEVPSLVFAVSSCALWVSYFNKSLRVKNTFVN
ncbi:MAG: DUF2569 family protein [Acidobacteriota bacterium]